MTIFSFFTEEEDNYYPTTEEDKAQEQIFLWEQKRLFNELIEIFNNFDTLEEKLNFLESFKKCLNQHFFINNLTDYDLSLAKKLFKLVKGEIQ